jgi:hypothetical protein
MTKLVHTLLESQALFKQQQLGQIILNLLSQWRALVLRQQKATNSWLVQLQLLRLILSELLELI